MLIAMLVEAAYTIPSCTVWEYTKMISGGMFLSTVAVLVERGAYCYSDCPKYYNYTQ